MNVMIKYSIPEIRIYAFETVAASEKTVPSGINLTNNAAGNLGNAAYTQGVINAVEARKVSVKNVLGFNQ